MQIGSDVVAYNPSRRVYLLGRIAELTILPGVICGSPAGALEELQSPAAPGIGGALLRFRHGPTPNGFARNGFRPLMGEVAPHIAGWRSTGLTHPP